MGSIHRWSRRKGQEEQRLSGWKIQGVLMCLHKDGMCVGQRRKTGLERGRALILADGSGVLQSISGSHRVCPSLSRGGPGYK